MLKRTRARLSTVNCQLSTDDCQSSLVNGTDCRFYCACYKKTLELVAHRLKDGNQKYDQSLSCFLLRKICWSFKKYWSISFSILLLFDTFFKDVPFPASSSLFPSFLLNVQLEDKILLQLEFEPRISGVGSNCFTNWATISALCLIFNWDYKLLGQLHISILCSYPSLRRISPLKAFQDMLHRIHY